MMLQMIMDCVTIFLIYFFGFNLNDWRIGKAKKWNKKHVKEITLKHSLFSDLVTDDPRFRQIDDI